MLSNLAQDLGFAVRQFKRSPGFAITAALTLALGIGATTAIFSLVDGILLRPLPFFHSDQLVSIDTLEFAPGSSKESGSGNQIGTSYPDFFDWTRQNHTFASLASYDRTQRLFSKNNGEGARVLMEARVSANFFSTLGVAPILGRAFTPDEEHPGHRVVILSHELWVSDFASSPNAIGQMVRISDEPSIIVGVMPEDFRYPLGNPGYFWTTFAADAEGPSPLLSKRSSDRLSILGRMKPGVNLEQAQADLNTIQRGLSQQYSEDRDRLGVMITPLLDESVSGVRSALTLLLSAVGGLLLVACANVSGLLLGRSRARSAELALRTALGANRGRVLRQLLVEAGFLAVLGGAAGIVLALALLGLGIRVLPIWVPRLWNVTIEGRVLAFAVTLSAMTAIISGLLPAWKMSRSDPADTLREGQSSTTQAASGTRVQHAIIVGETALSFMLLIGSGLLIRSMMNVLLIKPGFDTEHTVGFDIALTNKRYPDPSKVAFLDKLLPELAALPGVERASAAHPLPIYWPRSSWASFTVPGHPAPPDDPPGAISAVADPGYFETLSIPLLQGRTFAAHDNDPKSALVAIINQSFARRYFPGEDPIGRQFVPQFEHSNTAREIVGVVGDTRTGDVENPYLPEFFLPYAQEPTHQRPLVVLKVFGDPRSYENAVRTVVAKLDSQAPVFRYLTFPEDIARQAADPRFQATLVSSFAALALLLAAIGLYSVLSYLVGQRTRELGLRMALGASRGDVLQLVLQRGVFLTVLGIVVGALGSILGTRIISSLLFRVAPIDRSIYLIVAGVLVITSVVAALAPAARAATLDPIRTLREQ